MVVPVCLVLCLAGLVLCGPVFANHPANPGWYWENPLPAGYRDYNDVSMIGDEVWVAADGAMLLHSADAGRTWTPRSTNDGTHDLDLLRFVSPTVAWATRMNGGVYRSTNGGSSWSNVLPLLNGRPEDLFALDATHAWVQYSNAGVAQYRTADGGATWQTTTPPKQLADVVFTTVSDGWAVGNTYVSNTGVITATSTIYRTTNGGATWTDVRTTQQEELMSIAVPTSGVIVAGGATVPHYTTAPTPTPLVVRSGNGGGNWTTFTPTDVIISDVISLAFGSSTHGWAGVSNQSQLETSVILETTDGGVTWTTACRPGASNVACNAAGDAVAVGDRAASAGSITSSVLNRLLGAHAGAPFASADPSAFAAGESVLGLAFADGLHGWAMHPQRISRTENGGASWDTPTRVTTHGSLAAVEAVSSTDVWAVGQYGMMFHSTDGGATWPVVDATTSADLVAIDFTDASTGWAVGQSSLIHTVDGASWNPIYPNGSHTWSDVVALPDGPVVVSGGDSLAGRDCVLRSLDGGLNWSQTLTAGPNVRLTGLCFRTATEGWAYGEKAALYHTTNAGQTWSVADYGPVLSAAEKTQFEPTAMVFKDSTTGFVTASLGLTDAVMLKTTDGGSTWSKIDPGFMGNVRPFAMGTAAGRLWIGCNLGTIFADFNADSQAPVTTSSYDGLWSSQPVDLTFSAVETGAGLAWTRSNIAGGAFTYGSTRTVAAPSSHSNDGAYKVSYQSADWLGQVEPAKTQLVKIDTLAPTTVAVKLVTNTVSGFVGPNPTFRWWGMDYADPAVLSTHTSIAAVDVDGGYAYIAEGTALRVVDVSNPTHPQPLGFVDLGVTATSVALSDGFVCMTAGKDGLFVVDVRDPEAPDVTGRADVAGDAAHVAVSNGFAFVACGGAGVGLVDVRDPRSPRQAGVVELGAVADVAAAGDLLCVADGSALRTFNVSRPDSPELLGAVALAATARGVAIGEDMAWVADGPSGLYTVSVSPDKEPRVIDHPSLGLTFTDVSLDAGFVSLLSPSGLVLVDSRWPAATFASGTLATTGTPLAIDSAGQYTYLAEGASGLEIRRVMPLADSSYMVDTTAGSTPDLVADGADSSATLSGLGGGQQYLHVRPRDEAGNWGPPATFAFTVDAAGPTVADNHDGQTHQAFTLVLSPSDASGSGVAATYYRIDGGAWKAGTSVTLRLAIRHKRTGVSRGTHTIEYYARDRVGNDGSTGSCQVILG